MKPAPMTDGHIDAICINTVNGTTGFALSFARAIIDARDKQWAELLSKQEEEDFWNNTPKNPPVAWRFQDPKDGHWLYTTHITDLSKKFWRLKNEVFEPLYTHPAPEQEKP